MVKRAAIDIGTNSVRLLIAEISDGRIEKTYKQVLTTRLGQGLNNTGMLSETAVNKTIDAIDVLAKKAISMGAQSILAIATSAVRDAINGQQFIRQVQNTGVSVRVLSGKQEAELGFLGATAQMSYAATEIVVVDIGGGSTELVRGDYKGIIDGVSLNLGAVRLTERLSVTGPIGPLGLERISQHVTSVLEDTNFFIETAQGVRLVGIGGTITSLAAIILGMEVYNRDLIHGHVITLGDIDKTLKKIAPMGLDDRKKLPGLQPERADIIVAGTVILICLMKRMGIESIEVSEWDNLEGLIYSHYIYNHKLSNHKLAYQ